MAVHKFTLGASHPEPSTHEVKNSDHDRLIKNKEYYSAVCPGQKKNVTSAKKIKLTLNEAVLCSDHYPSITF